MKCIVLAKAAPSKFSPRFSVNCATRSGRARPKVASGGAGSDSRAGRVRVRRNRCDAGQISVRNSEKSALSRSFPPLFSSSSSSSSAGPSDIHATRGRGVRVTLDALHGAGGCVCA